MALAHACLIGSKDQWQMCKHRQRCTERAIKKNLLRPSPTLRHGACSCVSYRVQGSVADVQTPATMHRARDKEEFASAITDVAPWRLLMRVLSGPRISGRCANTGNDAQSAR